MSDKEKIIFIVGPTAVGKSSAALKLASDCNGEIVSCDSMQVYKEINIASNKPTDDELQRILHHCVNVISVEDEFDVAQFNQMANKAIKEILANGKMPVIVGGSGLYMQVLLDGLFEDAPRNVELRKLLINQLEEHGSEYLHQQLLDEDPKAAEAIHPNDSKRIVRALEVCTQSEKSFTERKEERSGLWDLYDVTVLCLDMDRERLYEKINLRVEQMFENGLIDEVKSLPINEISLTAKSLIGVKEVLSILNDQQTIEDAKEEMKKNTRHFAKRQLTWYRRDSRIQWIDCDEIKNLNELVEAIKKKANVS